MQESVQMIAWILSDDEPAQRRHQEIDTRSVTVAEYNDHYLAYLKGTDVSSTPPKDDTSFVKMHQYGPWNTLDASHVREPGKLLLAITLRAEDEYRTN
ncbi:uncharacterized protein BO95DRAFT_461912 [Aspergillus brunneoviolaceus CBS 621.78]|uniref:Uncharacterized protein n=1 Tax=Aspergillus brunneoviolaceus CBS 621.78 TaxID=1450534 RepID=A0ACD1GE59_9EURO|nr:hypothetical protein BO95DRAFT_461912 [Aspergillus brunneoviolaceus CBS 621.78]RAH47533.1 hypothetical protein BO95DRAFT_461912 [Aspergillus brunneoviolaceus CBS 621.78]